MGILDFVKELNKEEKKEILIRGNEIPEVRRFSTGSLSLDAECGSNSVGEAGLAIGTIVGLTGEESAGKSVVATKAAAGFQQAFPTNGIVWIDAEGAYDPTWVKTLGLNPDDPNFYVMRPEFSEQAFNAVLKAVDNNVGLIVLDSLGTLSPKDEMEAEMEKVTIGIQARLNRKMLRMFRSTINDSDFELPSTLIYINHLNEKVGGGGPTVGGAVPLVEPGGRALKFFPSIKIRLKKGGHYPKSVSVADEGVEPKAQELKFHIEKNKTAPPFRRGHVWFYFDSLDTYRTKGSYDTLEEAIRYGKKYELIHKSGGYLDLLDSNTGEAARFHGSNALAEHLRNNSEARESLERQVIKCVRGDMIEHGKPLSEDEGDNKQTGKKSSKGDKGETSSSKRSNSVGEAGHSNGSSPSAAQIDLEAIAHD